MRLYHGSDVAVEHPTVRLNSGFADLGRGFYLTDDPDVARARARTRARRGGSSEGVVSVFELDEDCLPWVTWEAGEPQLPSGVAPGPFALRFGETPAGVAAWVAYIVECRAGRTAVGELGEPALVRGWIATEEVEMVCAGLIAAAELAEAVDVRELVVQWCLRDQGLIDRELRYCRTLGTEAFVRRPCRTLGTEAFVRRP